MADYDGLPLDTPTKISENADFEIWATRTPNGGTVEHRPKPASSVTIANNNDATLRQRALAALATNTIYLANANPSVAQNTAQTKAMTRQVNGIIRLLLGKLDTITDS